MTAQDITDTPHDGSSVLTAEKSHEQVIAEALSVIDAALTTCFQRELMSAGEVADLLLDVRSLLADSRD